MKVGSKGTLPTARKRLYSEAPFVAFNIRSKSVYLDSCRCRNSSVLGVPLCFCTKRHNRIRLCVGVRGSGRVPTGPFPVYRPN